MTEQELAATRIQCAARARRARRRMGAKKDERAKMEAEKRQLEAAKHAVSLREFSKALAAGQLSAPALRGVHAGVQLGWLKQFVKQVPPGMSTLDVVLKIIKPATKERLCRYVLLAQEESPGAVGTAKIFASHTWRAPFRDLVAALAHVANDKDYVWIDVRRRPRAIAAPPPDAPPSN